MWIVPLGDWDRIMGLAHILMQLPYEGRPVVVWLLPVAWLGGSIVPAGGGPTDEGNLFPAGGGPEVEACRVPGSGPPVWLLPVVLDDVARFPDGGGPDVEGCRVPSPVVRLLPVVPGPVSQLLPVLRGGGGTIFPCAWIQGWSEGERPRTRTRTRTCMRFLMVF